MTLAFAPADALDLATTAMTECAMIVYRRPDARKVEVALQLGPVEDTTELLAALLLTLRRSYPEQCMSMLANAIIEAGQA
jgi:hypothetical protein